MMSTESQLSRELREARKKLAELQLENERIEARSKDLELTVAALTNIMDPKPNDNLTSAMIIEAICAESEIAKQELISQRRQHHLSALRQVGYYIAKKWTPRSLPAIGRAFGGRDHSTVLYGLNKVQSDLDTYAPMITAIERRLGLT
jgi:chromosomal replication initiator protein